jgi:hypothetical protein
MTEDSFFWSSKAVIFDATIIVQGGTKKQTEVTCILVRAQTGYCDSLTR